MKSMESMVKADIQKYVAFGMSLEAAAKKVKALRLGRFDIYVDRVVKQLS